MAAWNMAEAQDRMAKEQHEETRRCRNNEWKNAIAALPMLLEHELPAARKSYDNALLLLAKVKEVLRDLQPANWFSLYCTSPVPTEVIYSRLRKSLVPFLRSLWQAKHKIPSSACPLLRNIAQSLSFTDFAGLVGYHEKKV
jgi:hypothetical protein